MASIRPAASGDLDAIAAITNHYVRHTAIHFGSADVTVAELRSGFGGRHPWLVAEADGRVIGFAKAGPWRAREAYRFTAETGVYLAPEHHGAGVGGRLYAALLDACDAAGFHTLVAGVALPNEASVRLHDRLGFRRVGVFREVGFKLDAWHDVLWLQRGP